jgi:Ankyrin repeats (3 copies)
MNRGPRPIGVGTGGGSLPYVVEPQPAATAARKKRRRVRGRWATVSPLPLHPLRGFRPGSECIADLRGGVGRPFSIIEQMVSEALQALYEGDRARAEQLLAPDDELSAYEAAAFGRTDRLRRLLEEDPANATTWSPDGFTALHLAIFGGSEEAVRLLIEHGADVDALATSDVARVRPLGTAAFVGRPDLEKLLLEAGANASLLREERRPSGS